MTYHLFDVNKVGNQGEVVGENRENTVRWGYINTTVPEGYDLFEEKWLLERRMEIQKMAITWANILKDSMYEC